MDAQAELFNAGHVRPRSSLLRPSFSPYGRRPPDCVIPESDYEWENTNLKQAKTLFMCSDGVTENRDVDDMEFGEERLVSS